MSRNGKPLPEGVRKKMEASFGADFSNVRVHTDASSGETVPAGARAFTTGQDIFFGQGAYNPDSTSGQRLIAHELTHVVQQKAGRVAAPGSGGAKVQQAERELSGHLAAGGMKAAVK